MTRRTVVMFSAFVLLASAACGQWPGVHETAMEQAVQQGVAPGDASGLSGPAGTTAGTSGTGSEGAGAGGSAGAGGGTTGGGTTGGGSGVSGGGGTTSGDTTGVTAGTIKIGIHAPLTGAAPLKASSFEAGKERYWDHGNGGKRVLIYGRRVVVEFRDDQYNPSHAKQVCQEMVEREKVFLLIGGGGTDQIQACAQYAAGAGVPYLSGGVTETGLRELWNYFAGSMSYPEQARVLPSYIKKVLKVRDASRVAMVATDTANFDDAVQAFTQAFPGVRVFRPGKNERGSSMAQNLCTATQKNYDVVFPLTAPTYYLEMAKAAQCRPRYVGVGITMGLDTVGSTGCEGDNATQGARFFSPAPAFQDSDRYDRGFRAAGGADDIEWLLWGLSKSLHQLLLKAGQNLTREGFVYSTSRASVRSGVFPDAKYSTRDHFGALNFSVLENVCARRGNQAGYYVTRQAFVNSF
jgi:branched-chain amino acid transport system substrate-binding protein